MIAHPGDTFDEIDINTENVFDNNVHVSTAENLANSFNEAADGVELQDNNDMSGVCQNDFFENVNTSEASSLFAKLI